MATAAYGGMTGSITVAALVTEIKNFELKRTVQAGDAASMASAGFVERVPLMKGGECSFESLQAPGVVGAQGTITAMTKATGGATYQAACVITKITDTTEVRGVVTFKCEAKLSGTITVT